MSSPVCLEAVPAKRFLTTLGESTKRWLSSLSLMYMEMERWHVPTAFHIRVPRIAKDEWRCNGGKCTQPNHTVPTLSLAGLFPHHAPKRFAHTVRFAVGSDDIGNCRAATRGNNSIDADGGAMGRAYRLALDTVAFDATHNVSDCSKCGYLFVRRPLRRVGLNGSLVAAMVNLSSKSTQFYSSTPFDLVAHASRMIAAAHKLSCMEVNYDAGRSRDVKPAHVLDVLRGNGTCIRFYHRKRPSGTASNAHGMMCAIQAGLLVTELGTQISRWRSGALPGSRASCLGARQTAKCCMRGARVTKLAAQSLAVRFPFSAPQTRVWTWRRRFESLMGLQYRFRGRFIRRRREPRS